MADLRIGLAQINCTVGDLEGNFQKIKVWLKKAKKLGLDIVAFPELSIVGYPPEDLLLKPRFIDDNLKKIKELAKFVEDTTAIVGFVDRQGENLYNAAAIIRDGKIAGIYHKMCLPNQGVFDEKRYFKPGNKTLLFKITNVKCGVNICEDIWQKEGPTKEQSKKGAKIIFTINASPYHQGKIKKREKVIKKQAKENKVFIVYTNLVGGQDELVFDGQSMAIDSNGNLVARARAFEENLLVLNIGVKHTKPDIINTNIVEQYDVENKGKLQPSFKKAQNLKLKLQNEVEIYQALKLGLGDYVKKNGFRKVVIGLSGGIDSSLVAALAVDTLGRENVVGVFMPSRFSSRESLEDASILAKNLKIKLLTIPIEPVFKAYLESLEPYFRKLKPDIAEENIQARIRGNILMALSNKFGWLVLAAGNKSEMSVGYATLYGDMAGGFAPIKDIPKTMVYKLAEYRNFLSNVIPKRVLIKQPSAELRENQKDQDSLPPYEILDQILKEYVENDSDFDKITNLGFDKKVVAKVIAMVDKSEYKRRQAPPGIKITPKAFGKDRRMPITNKYYANKT